MKHRLGDQAALVRILAVPLMDCATLGATTPNSPLHDTVKANVPVCAEGLYATGEEP